MIEYYIWRATCSCIAISGLFFLLAGLAALMNQEKMTKVLVAVFAISLVCSFIFGDLFVIITCGKVGLGY